jgi:histidine ammonia-lyase
MGTIAARKARKILEHTATVLAIEWVSAAQAYEFVKPMKLGKGTGVAYELLRKHVAALEEDRVLAPDLRAAKDLLWENQLLEQVEKAVAIV